MRTLKGILAFLQVIMYITGIFSVDVNVSYSANTYNPPEITTPMRIVENSVSDFVIVTRDKPDKTIITAVNELKTYIKKSVVPILNRLRKVNITPKTKRLYWVKPI